MPPMDPFNSARRELLRFGGIGLAAAATTAMPAAYAAAQRSPNPSAAQSIFDIRTYGAVGDGKAVDSPATRRSKPRQPQVAALFCFLPEPGFASPFA
jgi:hypothetical protein